MDRTSLWRDESCLELTGVSGQVPDTHTTGELDEPVKSNGLRPWGVCETSPETGFELTLHGRCVGKLKIWGLMSC